MRLFAMLLSLSVLALGGVAAARTDQPSGPAVGFSFDSGTTVWVFPHLFHLDASNTSSITVTNHSQNVTIDLDIDFRTQVGDEIAEVNVQVAPRATRSFPLADTVDEGFVGTAVIFCGGDPCLAVGTWEFDFGEDNRFLVGVPPSSATTSDTEWATVTNDPTGSFAVAVFNNTFNDNDCTLRHYNDFGDSALTEEFTLASAAQRAAFTQVPEGFTGRTEVSCEGNVWVTTVVQSPANGFPTVGFPMKLTPEP